MSAILDQLVELTSALSSFLWGPPVLILLVATGAYLTFRLGLVQLFGFRQAVKVLTGRYHQPKHAGEVSHFQALSTALSATVGTGNIAGVATAISLGGPGALFWMWITALFGMATKFAECTLALKFREISPDGEISGGPMYTLLHGLKQKRLAQAFALFALIASFGIGNMVQANSVVDGVGYLWPEVRENAGWVGLAMALLVGMVIIGGIKRIASVASFIVPFMAILYLIGGMIVLFTHLDQIPSALYTIVNYAINPAAVGGAAVGEAIRWGVARGLFSNEAGMGSSPMAHAAAKTNEPVNEGLVAMLEPFIDTLIICTITGLVIIVTDSHLHHPPEVMGASLTAYAFGQVLGNLGSLLVGVSLSLFAFSTIIAWSYYGDRCARFLFGERAVPIYRIVYVIAVAVGAYIPLALVWNLADITNLLMVIPNLIALVGLTALVVKLKKDYFSRH